MRGAGRQRGRCWLGWRWVLPLLAALGRCGAALTPLLCPPEYVDHCQPESNKFGDIEYIVDEKHLKITNGKCFTLYFQNGWSLDGPLPRFESAVHVSCAMIVSGRETMLPALRDLNLFVSDKLVLRGGTLRNESLNGLTELHKLMLLNVNFEPSARDLRHLSGLRILNIETSNVIAATLDLLPADLEVLRLVNTRIGRVPAAALARLSRLTSLLVTNKGPLQVEAMGSLRQLTMNSEKADLMSLALPGELESLTITGWAPPKPQPWEACAKLGVLELIRAAARVLPAGWVANCTALHTLTITSAKNLSRLDNGTLRGATELTHLSLKDCALDALPASLLNDTPKLVQLDLSNNHLLTLPGGLFWQSNNLEKLLLSYNRLNYSVLNTLDAAGGMLPALSELHLDGNKALDLCPTERLGKYVMQKGMNVRLGLSNLHTLSELNLSYTNTSQVCADWLMLRNLRMLNLAYTAITRLQLVNLPLNTRSEITVKLTGTNVNTLVFERKDWATLTDDARPVVNVKLSERALSCDCNLYWVAVALNHSNTRLRVDGAQCADGRPLSDVPRDELLCAVPEHARARCPANCTCGERDDEATKGRVLRLACAGAGLHRVPSADELLAALPGHGGYALDLCLANNSIKALGPGDLPPYLARLDLRNNSLTLVDAATAKKLVSRTNRRVWLAGNPLDCGCQAADTLAAVRSSPDVFADRADTTCAGGASLMAAAIEPPTGCKLVNTIETGDGNHKVVVAAALAVVVAVAAAAALALLRPELRLRAKAAMRAWGLLPRARESDDGRVYDAFVSFAHADEAVVLELVERLESGAAPLRLCVHYRDWAPGGWIPTQIAASVRVSRRTVAVVSAAFLRSKWARAEFREAYAAALRDAEPRLVVVLLEDPSRLPLDAELRAYLAANTYVRWGDPWFWLKLRRALPAPRRPARHPPSTDASALSDVSVQLPVTESTGVASMDASVRSASTDMSVRSTVIESTDASIRSTVTGSTDVSVQSAMTASTDASIQSAATAATNASVRSTATGSTDVSDVPPRQHRQQWLPSIK